jgi:hypothetical protein
MKNNILQGILPLLFLCMVEVSHAQYVTLKEKQFYDQSGQPFYPVICNYWVHMNTDYPRNNATSPLRTSKGYCTNCSVSHFEIQPECRYGSTPDFEATFTNGDEMIRADLTKMLEMGFNTVRVFGFQFEQHDQRDCRSPYKNDRFNQGGRYICRNYTVPNDVDAYFWWGEPLRAKAPYSTDPVLQNIVLPKIHQFLDIAGSVGIKVILLTGGGAISASDGTIPSTGSVNTNNTSPCIADASVDADAEQVNEFKEYHEALTFALRNRTEIMAYDLFNEQGFGVGRTIEHNGLTHYLRRINTVKSKICENTTLWYDAIKAVDPNHLITIANTDIRDIFNFDATVMKIDFNSYHIYPDWETRAFENYNKTLAMNRLKTEFYWINNNSPIPWVLGETGAAAWTAAGQDVFGQNTNQALPSYTTTHVNENLSTMPLIWGNFDEQTAFAQQSQNLVINYGGNGYAWWSFQDAAEAAGFDIPGKDPNYHWINLLENGDPAWVTNHYEYTTTVNNDIEKPLVNNAFTANTVYTKNAPADQPADYYNAWSGQYYTIHGYVYDNYGYPIKDAVVHGSNRWAHDAVIPDEIEDPKKQFDKFFGFDVYTFTNADGYYELKTPITGFVSPLKYDYTKFDFVRASAPGASVAEWYPTYPASGTNYYYNNQVLLFNIEKSNGVFDKTASNITISNGENETYTARHKLTTQDVTAEAGGTGDFYAGTEVEVKSGFDARQGSEVFLHTAMVKPDCNLSPAFKTDESHKMKKKRDEQRQIEAHYQLPVSTQAFKLLPNPAQRHVTVFSAMPASGTVSVYAPDGMLATPSQPLTGHYTTLNIDLLPAGCYEVRIFTDTETKSLKLITLKN